MQSKNRAGTKSEAGLTLVTVSPADLLPWEKDSDPPETSSLTAPPHNLKKSNLLPPSVTQMAGAVK